MTDFQAPKYEVWAVVFTAVGAAISYGRMSSSQVRAYVLSALFDGLFQGDGGRLRLILEFLVFIILGIIVAVGLTQPTTVFQALSAGLGWTALAAKHK